MFWDCPGCFGSIFSVVLWICWVFWVDVGVCRKLLPLFMDEREVEPDVISYTACIKACAKAGELDRALALFSAMEHFGVVPDKYTSAGRTPATCHEPKT